MIKLIQIFIVLFHDADAAEFMKDYLQFHFHINVFGIPFPSQLLFFFLMQLLLLSKAEVQSHPIPEIIGLILYLSSHQT